MTDDPMAVPSFSTTYKRADGEQLGDVFGWVTDLDHFDDEDEPVLLIEETWERTSARRFWLLPPTLYDCAADPDCDEDAVRWVMKDGAPVQACALHAAQGWTVE